MHLNEQDIAKAAEALSKGHYNLLSQETKEHLSQCDECAMEVQTVSSIVDEIQAPKNQKNHKSINIIKVLSGIAACTLISVGVWKVLLDKKEAPIYVEAETSLDTFITNRDTTNNSDTPKDSIQYTKEEITINEALQNKDLVAFQSHKELENLVHRFEEGNLRGKADIHFPNKDITVSLDKTRMQWKNPNKEELIIEFFNNNGDKLFELNSSEEDANLKLDKIGLYYYKVLNEDFDLIFCGRLKVTEALE